jgi:hypothetical protein
MNYSAESSVVSIRPPDYATLRTIFLVVPKGAVWGMSNPAVRCDAYHGVLRDLDSTDLNEPIWIKEGEQRRINTEARLSITMRFGTLSDESILRMRNRENKLFPPTPVKKARAVATAEDEIDMKIRNVTLGPKVKNTTNTHCPNRTKHNNVLAHKI